MAKIIEVLHSGKASNFRLRKINRSKLYGSKKRIPIDAQGQECSRAGLTRDGKYILPNGGVALLYLDKDSDVAERNQLRGVDADGEVVESENSSSDTSEEAVQVVTPAEVLECVITHAYVLEPVFICAELEESLSAGAIYRLSDCNDPRRFLIGNGKGYFMLVGKRTGFEFVGLAEADLSPPDFEAEDMYEDLDFCMF